MSILHIDDARREVLTDEGLVRLTRREWAVFIALVERGGRPAPARELMARCWGLYYDTSNVRVVMRRLREKLPGTIERYRMGYRIPRRALGRAS